MWPGNHSLSSLSKPPMDVSTLTGCLWPDEEGYGQHLSLIKTHRTKFHGKAEHRKPGPERARGKYGMKSMVLMSCVLPDNTTRLDSPHLKTGRAISTLHVVRGVMSVSLLQDEHLGGVSLLSHSLSSLPSRLSTHSLPTDTVRPPEEGRPAFAKTSFRQIPGTGSYPKKCN